MPVNITEEFVRFLMKQNEEQSARIAELSAEITSLNQTIRELKEQLKPELLENVCSDKEYPISLNMRDGYDHSYYFVASFIEDHIRFHLSKIK